MAYVLWLIISPRSMLYVNDLVDFYWGQEVDTNHIFIDDFDDTERADSSNA